MITKLKQNNHIGRRPGQSMVEFALVITVVLTLMLGLIEAGRLLFLMTSVYAAAREGARIGSSEENYLDCTAVTAAAQRAGFLTGGAVTIAYDSGPGTTIFARCNSSQVVAPVKSDNPTQFITCPNASYQATCKNFGKFSLPTRIVVTVTTNYASLVPIPLIRSFPITSTAGRTIMRSISRVDELPTPEPSPTSASYSCGLLTAPSGYPEFVTVGNGPSAYTTDTVRIHNGMASFTANLQKIVIASDATVDFVKVNGTQVWSGSPPAGGINVNVAVAPGADVDIFVKFIGKANKNKTSVTLTFDSTCVKNQ